jgi:large subunit ribosomal protein L6
MSRIGELPIPVPSGVKVSPSETEVRVEGPKGKTVQVLPRGIGCVVEGETLKLSRANNSKNMRALHGLARALVANAVTGTSTGFSKELQIEGIGYRAQLQGKELNMTLGFSHPVIYRVPDTVKVAVEGQNKISVSGIDRQAVGQVAAEIRALKPPEPYKGKGIRYANEQVKRKVGKTGA